MYSLKEFSNRMMNRTWTVACGAGKDKIHWLIGPKKVIEMEGSM